MDYQPEIQLQPSYTNIHSLVANLLGRSCTIKCHPVWSSAAAAAVAHLLHVLCKLDGPHFNVVFLLTETNLQHRQPIFAQRNDIHWISFSDH